MWVVPGGHPLGLQYRLSVLPRGVKGALRDSGAVEGTGWPVWGGPALGRRLRVLALRPLTPLANQLPANNLAVELDAASLVHTEASSVRAGATAKARLSFNRPTERSEDP